MNMVQLKPWMARMLFSKHWIYVLVILGVVYFTREPPSPNIQASKLAMEPYYDGNTELASLNSDGGLTYVEIPHSGQPRAPQPPPQVEQAAMVGPPATVPAKQDQSAYEFQGFHSSHPDQHQTGSNNHQSRDMDAVVAEEHRAREVVHMQHDPRYSRDEEDTKNKHFASSHHAQVAHGHAISSDKHGLYVPHTYESKAASHGHQDPYYSMHITENELEHMNSRLPPTLSNYRNPCWVEHLPRGFSYFEHTLYYQYYKYYPNAQPHRDWEKTYDKLEHLMQVRKKKTKDGKSWRLRCFPYFFLIGFTRAGTTDLWRSMSLLPEFVRGLIKEPKFWNKVRLHNYDESLPNATLSDYLDLYDGVSEVIRGFSHKRADGSYYHPGITADMDPQTIWKLPKWQHIRGNQDRDAPRVTTADHIHALKPDAKFIVMMRDPVERAFSHYCFFKTRKKFATKSELADKFHHDMVRASAKLTRCFKQRGAKSCAYQPPRFNALAMRSLTVGIYNVFINDWLKVFPKNHFLFIQSENYFQNRVKVIKEVSHFLGIDDTIPTSLVESIKEFKVMNPSKKTGMHRETRDILREFYRPFNKKLAVLLKHEEYHWDY